MQDYIARLKEKYNMKKVLLGIVVSFVAVELSILSVNLNQKIHFGIISVILIVFLSYCFWKKAIFFLLIWIFISGAIRKWVLPQLSDVVFFFGHLILTGVYLRYYLTKSNQRIILPNTRLINFMLGLFSFWCLLCAINPQLPSILVGMLGLIIYLYYIPLAFIIPNIIESKEEIIKYLKIIVFLSIPLLILGIVQYFSPPLSPINYYVGRNQESLAFVGSHVRIASTFSYISGYTAYLNVLILITTYLLRSKTLSFKTSFIFNGILVISIVNLLMTGSRGPFYITIFSVFLFLLLTGSINRSFITKHLLTFLISLAIFISFVSFTSAGKDVYESFHSRGQEDIIPRIISTFTIPFLYSEDIGIYGKGLGSTYQGIKGFVSQSYYKKDIRVSIEEETYRILWEVGIFGFILVFAIRFAYLRFGWLLVKKSRDVDLKYCALVITLFQIQFLVSLNSLQFNFTTSLIYWFLIGVLFTIPKLDKERSQHATV